jgi:hypothetical protein
MNKELERDELREQVQDMWKKGEAFFMQGTSNSPYDGCFYEPNLFLVMPPKSDMAKCVNKEGKGKPVLPLYVSGQGRLADTIESLDDLLTCIEDGSFKSLQGRKSRFWEDGFKSDKYHPYEGDLELESCHALGPINEQVSAAERYWMKALEAEDLWGIELQWKCEKCGRVLDGGKYENEPTPTGYTGDGGIGIHWEGVMCQECADNGICDCCRNSGDGAEVLYDVDVAENGWSLCRDHAKWLLEDAIGFDGEEAPDLRGKAARLVWWIDEDQLSLPGIKPDPRLVLMIDDREVKGLTFDEALIEERAEKQQLEHLQAAYGVNDGVYFNADVLEDLIET